MIRREMYGGEKRLMIQKKPTFPIKHEGGNVMT